MTSSREEAQRVCSDCGSPELKEHKERGGRFTERKNDAAKEPKTTDPNTRQVGGTHYQDNVGVCPHCGGVIQHWDLFAKMPYLVGQVTRYVLRFASKNGREDLEKALHFLHKLIEVYYPKKKDMKQ